MRLQLLVIRLQSSCLVLTFDYTMKLALILGFCLALASARLQRFDDLSLLDDLESGPSNEILSKIW